jgi:hypothetical protein
MTSKSKTKKQLEATQGHKPVDTAVQLSPELVVVATSTRTRGAVTLKNQFIEVPNICFENNLLDVAGVGKTASNGQSLFRLSRFICPTGELFPLP